MTFGEAEREIVDTLKLYFSAPIAKAIVTSSLRRAGLDPLRLELEAVPALVRAVEKALPSYLGDPSKTRECAQLLRNVAAKLSPNAEAPASRTSRDVERPRGLRPVPTSPANDSGESRLASSGAVPVRDDADGSPSSTATVIRVERDDDVVNAWEVGRDICRGLGFAGLEQTKIATAISELARNILLYAAPGDVIIRSLDAPRRGVEIVASDKGPGIPDVSTVLSEGYKSRRGMGIGLRGTKRIVDDFDVLSVPGKGTTVTIRKYLR